MEQTTQLIELSQSNPGKKEYERKEVGGGGGSNGRQNKNDRLVYADSLSTTFISRCCGVRESRRGA